MGIFDAFFGVGLMDDLVYGQSLADMPQPSHDGYFAELQRQTQAIMEAHWRWSSDEVCGPVPDDIQ